MDREAKERGAAAALPLSHLGYITPEKPYELARAAAMSWRAGKHAGVTADSFTVADACREYVDDRRAEKGDAAAEDADKRFSRLIYGDQRYPPNPIGRVQLAKLREPVLKQWLRDLNLSVRSEIRELTALKAALNLAVRNRRVHASAAIEWKHVTGREDPGTRRDLFLDRQQRQALLDRLRGGLRDIAEAAALTGARPGEPIKATRGSFDPRTGSATFSGKTGPRTVPLSPAAITLLERMGRNKLPGARLFTQEDGRPWKANLWGRLMDEAAQLAALPKGTCMYTLRHSWITEALLGGMPTLEVARLVGTSVQQIENHYGHLVTGEARKRLAKVRML